MKRVIMILVCTLFATSLFAQRKDVKTSKWSDNKDGKSYRMEAKSTSYLAPNGEKSHISFNIEGATSDLKKITLTSKKGQEFAVTLSNQPQYIPAEPGDYTFKFHHEKLGVQGFEINVKNGEGEAVTLTLK